MKKLFLLLASFTLVFGLVSCGGSSSAKYKDGNYYAEEAEFDKTNGFKPFMLITVKGGKITAVEWNGFNANSVTKKSVSEAGEYGMVEKGKAKAEWHVQAAAVEKYIVDKQGMDLKYDDKGKSDAISGATITLKPAQDLFDAAIKAGVQAPGTYKDGDYHETGTQNAQTGFTPYLNMIVRNGHIKSVTWDETAKDPANAKDTKKSRSAAGTFKMAETSTMTWDKQSKLYEEYLMKNQTTKDIKFTDKKQDAVSGATINLTEIVAMTNKILGIK